MIEVVEVELVVIGILMVQNNLVQIHQQNLQQDLLLEQFIQLQLVVAVQELLTILQKEQLVVIQ